LVSVWFYPAILFLLVVGCGDSEKQEPVDSLSFDVVDSLLEPAYAIVSANKSVRPPVDFKPVDDSLLSVLKKSMENNFGGTASVELHHLFFDSARGAGMLISEIKDIDLLTDTAGFLSRYRNTLHERYGSEKVREGEYAVGEVTVKNFLVTDSMHVRFQLICFSEGDNAIELDYFSPHAIYPDLVKAIESSIGSLKLIKSGGE